MDWRGSREDEGSPVRGAGMAWRRAWMIAWMRGVWRLREKQGCQVYPGIKSGAVLRGREHWRGPGLDGEQP